MAGEPADHLVAYLDLLGFRDAIAAGTDRRLVVDLLKKLAANKGDFTITSSGDDDSKSYSIRPAVTAFSDNIVVSYPLAEMPSRMNVRLATMFLTSIVGFVAWNALASGFLIRGGIAIGELHHSDGIVAGPAMIEAYQIENGVAVFPRVVYSKRLSDHPEVGGLKLGITDQDGLFCMHYMREVILRTSFSGGMANLDIKPWVDRLRNLCKENVAKFEKAGDLRRLSKWNWFSAYLERTIGGMDRQLIEMSDSPKQPD